MEQAKIIPSNRGTPWTSDLDTKLVYAIATGKTIEDCETYFQRTSGGITSRIMLIARRMVGKGIPIDAVSSTLNVSVSAINRSIRMSEISTENAQKRRDAKKEPIKTNSDSSTQTTSPPTDKMNSIDNEITILHARLATLEKMKADVPPIKSASELLIERRTRAENDKPRNNESPIATACRFSRRSELELLESVVESLNHIHTRLDRLEGRTS